MATKRRHPIHKKIADLGKVKLSVLFLIIAGLTFLALGGTTRDNMFLSLNEALSGRKAGWTHDNAAGCGSETARPCYDKLTSKNARLLGKNAIKAFSSCTRNAAPNVVGEFIHDTEVCGQEIVTYCHDGKSDNFLREFTGECSTEPPPPPQPTPEPTPTPPSEPTPTPEPDSIPFRIVYPDGGEELPFGSHQVVLWEGGDTVNEWPVYISINDRDRNVVIREMEIDLPNNGQGDWIVDLPIGDYYGYYGQGCRNVTCVSPSEWDYGGKFSVVAGDPVEKVNSTFPLNQSLVVLDPSGGETISAGDTHTIKWSGGNSSWRINISLIAGNQTYTRIIPDTDNDGALEWVVPEFVPPGEYKMYVECGNCGPAPSGFTGGFYTYSFYPFTIE